MMNSTARKRAQEAEKAAEAADVAICGAAGSEVGSSTSGAEIGAEGVKDYALLAAEHREIEDHETAEAIECLLAALDESRANLRDMEIERNMLRSSLRPTLAMAMTASGERDALMAALMDLADCDLLISPGQLRSILAAAMPLTPTTTDKTEESR